MGNEKNFYIKNNLKKIILVTLFSFVAVLIVSFFTNDTKDSNNSKYSSSSVDSDSKYNSNDKEITKKEEEEEPEEKYKVIPNILAVSFFSNNEKDKYYAEKGDIVTLVMMFDEELSEGPKVKINNKKVEVKKEDDKYIAKYIVDTQYSENKELTFEITDYKNIENNEGKKITKTTDNSKVIIKALNQKIEQVKTNSIEFDKKEAYITVNSKIKLNVTIKPSNAPQNLIWSTSDKQVAEVKDGLVIGKKEGTATIKVSNGSKEASMKIVVSNKEIKVDSIKLSSPKNSIYVGDKIKLNLSISPSNATNKAVTWSTSNTSVATISNGTVIGKKAGKTTITAKVGEKTAKVTISVVNKTVDVTKISLNKTRGTIYLNTSSKKITLIATVSPSNATNKKVSWSSSNTKVATVSNGVVTAKDIGTTIITAKAGGKTAKATITVVNKSTSDTNQVINVSSISLNKTSGTIYLNTSNRQLTLTATVSPSNATNKTVSWSSSNQSVASVSNGVVTAHNLGTTIITASSGGKTAKATINVVNQTINVTAVSLNKTSGTIYLNSPYRTISLSATISPTNATNKTVSWSSSNTKVATVSNGVVTAHNIGQATITATVEGKQASFNMIVKKKFAVIIGASQVDRMYRYKKSYTSKSNYSYSTNDSSLKYIYKGGTGIEYQYTGGAGWNEALSFINNYSSYKPYT